MADIDSVLGPDTPNTGRTKWNASDNAINAEVEQATADIAAHKAPTNTDHDTHNDGRYATLAHIHDERYYTETEIDAFAVKLAGAQTVAGVKTLTDAPVVKSDSAGIEFQTAAGLPTAKILGLINGSTDRKVSLQVYSLLQSQFIEGMRCIADDESADFPYMDLFMRGKKVATEEYANSRIRSGTYQINFSTFIASLLGSRIYRFNNAETGTIRIVPPLGSRISKLLFAIASGGTYAADVISEQPINYAMSISTPCVINLELSTGADDSGVVYTWTIWMATAGNDVGSIWSIDSAAMGLAKLPTSVGTDVHASLIMTY